MTAAALREPGRVSASIDRLRWAVIDALTITQRDLIVWRRVPAFLVFTLVQPVMFTLLFVYVFGGAIPVSTQGGYVNYLMPGIIGQTAAFASFGTAIALSREVQKGVLDRFRSMPMARSAVLTGRLIADSARMLVTILVIVAVGYAVGFRFLNGLGRRSAWWSSPSSSGSRCAVCPPTSASRSRMRSRCRRSGSSGCSR